MSRRVTALVAARDEADRVGETVRALRSLPELERVVVVDDGSTDGTASIALGAGAWVVRAGRRRGKGGTLEWALRRLDDSDVWLLADADLGSSAAGLARLLEEVLGGGADLAIGVLPEFPARDGGFGLVKRAAGRVIRAACGFEAVAPLSGQRAVTAAALGACRPLASGFGLETGMTIDAVRAGFRVVEVPVDATHRPTGRSVRGFVHRGRQGLEILRAAVPRLVGLR